MTMSRTAATRPTWLPRSFALKVRRMIPVLRNSPLPQAVAEAMHRLDRIAIGAEVLAEPADMGVHRAGVDTRSHAPHLGEELGATEELAGVLEEHGAELILERPQRELH